MGNWELLKVIKGVWFLNSLRAGLWQPYEMGQDAVMLLSVAADDNMEPRSSLPHFFLYLYIYVNVFLHLLFLPAWIWKQDANFAKLISLLSGEIE